MEILVVQRTFTMVRNSRSNVRPKMCTHQTSNTVEGAIPVLHAVEETPVATAERTLQPVHRATPVVNPAPPGQEKTSQGQHTNA